MCKELCLKFASKSFDDYNKLSMQNKTMTFIFKVELVVTMNKKTATSLLQTSGSTFD